MDRVEKIELQVRELSADELASFRAWFAEFDAAVWDEQLEDDARAGKLEGLAERALRDHAVGRSRKL
jgi:hypothetical protein